MNIFTEAMTKTAKYTKQERLTRLIELSVKGDANLDPLEMIEVAMIQAIREENGEIDEVLKDREKQRKYENSN